MKYVVWTYRLFVKWSKSSLVTFLSILFKLTGLFATVYYINKHASASGPVPILDYIVSNKDITIGCFLVLFFAILTIIKDVAALLDNGMTRIPFDTGLPSSQQYDILNFFDESTKRAIIVGLNLCPVLQKDRVIPKLLEMLKQKTTIILVLATPEQNISLGQRQQTDFIDSIKLLNGLESQHWATCSPEDRDLLKIRFHPDAASMSSLIRDPHKKDRGEIVTTVKWATDKEHDNRLFFVTTKWEHDTFFKKLHAPETDWLRGERLRDVSKRVEVPFHDEAHQ